MQYSVGGYVGQVGSHIYDYRSARQLKPFRLAKPRGIVSMTVSLIAQILKGYKLTAAARRPSTGTVYPIGTISPTSI